MRPASGVRGMQTVGPSRTLTPLDRASAASTSPMRSTSSGFQVEPMAMPQGSDSERRPVRLSPRTPEGPSDTLRDGMPRRSTGGTNHRLEPAVRDAFSSRVRRSSRSSIWATNRARSGWSASSAIGRASRASPTSAPLLPRPTEGTPTFRRRRNRGWALAGPAALARSALLVPGALQLAGADRRDTTRPEQVVTEGRRDGDGRAAEGPEPLCRSTGRTVGPSDRRRSAISRSGRSRAARGCRSRSRRPRRCGTRPRAPGGVPPRPTCPSGSRS